MRGLLQKREALKREFASLRLVRHWQTGEGLGNAGLEGILWVSDSGGEDGFVLRSERVWGYYA